MRLPRISLFRPTLSLDWLGSLIDRTTLLYVAYTLVWFVIFLVLTFPHDLVVRRVLMALSDGPVDVQCAAVHLAWFGGYELQGLTVRADAAPDGVAPFLESSRFFVRPSLGALLHGNPYAMVVQADLYGGRVDGEMALRGGTFAGSLRWNGLRVDRYRALTALLEDGQIDGRVSGSFDFEARGPNFVTGQGSGEVTIDDARLASAKVNGFTIPDLALAETRATFKVTNGRMEIQDLSASGDLTVQGSGQVVFRDPPTESTLNLRATFSTTPTTSDGIKGALALIPRPPGAKPDAPVTITGTLLRPRFR